MSVFDGFVNTGFIEQEYRFSEIYAYLEKYFQEANKSVDEPLFCNPDVLRDKTIWILWLQGLEAAPPIVKTCIESVIRNKPNEYDLVVLDEQSLKNYLVIPENIIRKYKEGKISSTHLSDIIRTGLLYLYGGVWVDSTVYCMAPIPQFMLEGDIFAFSLAGVMTSPVLKVSSWWLCSKHRSLFFLKIWKVLSRYWEHEESLIDYFLFHIVFSRVADTDPECKKLFSMMRYYNSGNAHILQSKLSLLFDEDEWNIIKQISPIQKLSYKTNYLAGDINSYYVHLLSDYRENKE